MDFEATFTPLLVHSSVGLAVILSILTSGLYLALTSSASGYRLCLGRSILAGSS